MKELFVSLSGAMSQEKRINVIANNLANMSTIGFKRDYLVSEGVFTSAIKSGVESDFESSLKNSSVKIPAPVSYNFGDKVYTRPADSVTDFSQGEFQFTGNKLDAAINGEGFFKVKVGEEIRYTRKGSFGTNNDGILVTQDGHPVLDTNDREISIKGSNIEMSDSGEIIVNGNSAGNLGVVNFDSQIRLQKAGATEFRVEDVERRQIKEIDSPSLSVGMIELSNVNGPQEMVTMIEAQHAYNSYQKAIKSSDEMTDNLIRTILVG